MIRKRFHYEQNSANELEWVISVRYEKYRLRGRNKRVGLVFRSKTIMDNPEITKNVKRNRVWRLIKRLN